MPLEREIGEIHTKVDHLIQLAEKQNGRVAKLEDQVGALRRWQSFIIGGCTSVGAGLGAAMNKLFG